MLNNIKINNRNNKYTSTINNLCKTFFFWFDAKVSKTYSNESCRHL